MDALQVVKAEVASAIVVKTESATVMVLDSSDEEANPQSIEVQRSEDVSEAEQQVKVNELGELHVVLPYDGAQPSGCEQIAHGVAVQQCVEKRLGRLPPPRSKKKILKRSHEHLRPRLRAPPGRKPRMVRRAPGPKIRPQAAPIQNESHLFSKGARFKFKYWSMDNPGSLKHAYIKTIGPSKGCHAGCCLVMGLQDVRKQHGAWAVESRFFHTCLVGLVQALPKRPSDNRPRRFHAVPQHVKDEYAAAERGEPWQERVTGRYFVGVDLSIDRRRAVAASPASAQGSGDAELHPGTSPRVSDATASPAVAPRAAVAAEGAEPSASAMFATPPRRSARLRARSGASPASAGTRPSPSSADRLFLSPVPSDGASEAEVSTGGRSSRRRVGAASLQPGSPIDLSD